MITCSKCGDPHPPEEFYQGKKRCKPCAKIYGADYYKKNSVKVLAQSAIYYQTYIKKETA